MHGRLQSVTRHIAEIVFHLVLDHSAVLVELILSTARRAVQHHVVSGPDGFQGPVAAQTEKSGMGTVSPMFGQFITGVSRILGTLGRLSGYHFSYSYNVMVTASEARLALALASSTDASLARATPMRRCPLTSGLPKSRTWVSGSSRALFRLPKAVEVDVP